MSNSGKMSNRSALVACSLLVDHAPAAAAADAAASDGGRRAPAVYRFCFEYAKMPFATVAGRRPLT